MLCDIFDYRPQPFALMIAGTFIRDIAKGAFTRAGLRTRGGQEEQRHPGVRRQPLLYGLRFMNLRVIDHHLEVSEAPRWIGMLKGQEEVQKQAVGFVPPDSVPDRARAYVQRPREIRYRFWLVPGVRTATSSPWGIHWEPTLGNSGISSSSAKNRTALACSRSKTTRIRANFSPR